MLDIRCECGKIVCQSDNEFVVIKCRHCKRFMFVKVNDYNHKVTITPHFLNNEQSDYNQYSKYQ